MESLGEEKIAQLRRLYNKAESLTHRKKTDDTYYSAKEVAREVLSIYDTSHTRLDVKILDKYSFKASDKQKDYIIEEFKKELMFDLRRIIHDKEHFGSAVE